jgi:hypothetical protein
LLACLLFACVAWLVCAHRLDAVCRSSYEKNQPMTLSSPYLR